MSVDVDYTSTDSGWDEEALAAWRADYAEQLLHHSAVFIGCVHDEGPDAVQEAYDRALILEAPPGMDPALAFATVIAAQVNAESEAVERLGWVAEGVARRLVRRPDDRDPSLAELNDMLRRVLDQKDREAGQDAESIRETAAARVKAAIAGHVSVRELPYQDRLVAVDALEQQGVSVGDSATTLQCSRNTIVRYRKAFRDIRSAA